jgi:hypothetical protein
MNELSGWMLAGGAAFLTFAATGWGHLKNLYQQIAGRVVVRLTVSGYQADAMMLYLKQHFVPSRFGPRAYIGWKLFVRPRRRVQLVSMEVAAPSGRVYWKGWLPIWVSKSKDKVQDLQSGLQAENYDYQTINITFFRGILNADDLIQSATELYNTQVKRYEVTNGRRHSIQYVHGTAGHSTSIISAMRGGGGSCPTSGSDIRACLTHRPLGWHFSDLGPDLDETTSAIDRLALNGETTDLVREARRWRETEEWHRERGLPWRRGYMLYGPPGTGKTALARALAEDLDLPVFVYDLASLKNDELQTAWNQMLGEVPCMALIEDIDAVFEHRKNVSVSTGPALTFDCLLNCLDGIQRADGLIVLMTTNHLEKIDPALGQPHSIASRPGRIDRTIMMNGLDSAGREKLATRILRGYPEWIEKVSADGIDDTPAQFQERCGRLALQLHYRDPELLPASLSLPTAVGLPKEHSSNIEEEIGFAI